MWFNWSLRAFRWGIHITLNDWQVNRFTLIHWRCIINNKEKPQQRKCLGFFNGSCCCHKREPVLIYSLDIRCQYVISTYFWISFSRLYLADNKGFKRDFWLVTLLRGIPVYREQYADSPSQRWAAWGKTLAEGDASLIKGHIDRPWFQCRDPSGLPPSQGFRILYAWLQDTLCIKIKEWNT